MRNRFSKVSQGKSWILILLAISGMTSSCKDEYLLDDEKPAWLDVSIYENLKRKGTFSNYLRLLADPDVNTAEDADNSRNLVDILSKTGSKTVFVADDNAWENFFRENALLPANDPWHYATSYENLSESQKKLLINTSMLPNSIVMENLSTDPESNTRGKNIRRQTDVANTDTITYISGDDLPVSYNAGGQEVDYWSRFRTEKGGKGIYIVNDGSQSMMIHFTNEYLKKQNITDKDFEKFLGCTRTTSDVHVYNHKLISKDSVCENGYVNTTEGVLKPLPNMAEIIRTNGKTNIFSHMLERWSAPFYNGAVTEAYKKVMAAKGINWTDSIFSKRYFSEWSNGGKPLNTDPTGNDFSDGESKQVSLKFDPGWNTYFPELSSAEQEMGAMFVPTDEALWEYFLNDDSGKGLVNTYAKGYSITPGNYTSLYQAIDQIPLSTLRALLNVIMFPRFSQSVPSKMLLLRNDVQEQIFEPEDRDKHLVGSMLASNGIVYITDKVYAPGDFTSVAAPAFISKDKLIVKWAIYNGSDNSVADKMGVHYYAYLRAMQSKFVFLMPNDNAMNYLYYPASFLSKRPRVVQMFMKDKKADVEVGAKILKYTPATGEIGGEYDTSYEKITDSDVIELLKDLLESHTIVLEGIDNIDDDIDEYYLAKNGAPIRVTRENGKVVRVQGGFQLENEQKGLQESHPGIKWNNVTEPRDMKNGTTYILDSPIVNASRSVFNIFSNNKENDSEATDSEEYGAFYDLCFIDNNIVQACGLVPSSTKQEQLAQLLKKYQIFDNEGGKAPDYNVQFFNNYRYTIFVPTREALEQAIANGLPTPDQITEDYENCCVDIDAPYLGLKTRQDSLRIQAKITYLQNFIRNHFVDNSVFVDQSRIPETEYVTACFDNKLELFNKVLIQRNAGTLQVRESENGQWLTVSGKYNIMARDVNTSFSPNKAENLSGLKIEGSSFAVIHQIPGTLNHTSLDENGQHAINWEDESSCRAYLKRFAIK